MNKIILTLVLLAASSNAWAFGRIPKKLYEEKVAALEQCSLSMEEARAQIASLEAARAQLEGKNSQLLSDMDASKDELERRVAQMTMEKQDIEKTKQAEVDKLKSTYEDLMKDMKDEIQQGSIQITQLQNKLSVNMVDKILFNSGASEVNDAGQEVLKRVANVLKKVQNKQIRIEGHTDSVPIGGALKEKYPSNWELSTARATVVARFLTEVGGIDPGMVSAAGYGQYRPIADNKTADGRTKNRRIEIALIPLEVGSATPPKQ